MAIINDTYMTYDKENHIYIPTTLLFVEKLNENLELKLGSKKEADLFAEDVAFFLKDFIMYYSHPREKQENIEKVEYLIYLNDEGQRNAWQRACVEFVRYALNDEGDMVGLQTGLNLLEGQIVDLEKLRGKRELSGRLERVLRNSGLLYGGVSTWKVPSTVTRGTDF